MGINCLLAPAAQQKHFNNQRKRLIAITLRMLNYDLIVAVCLRGAVWWIEIFLLMNISSGYRGSYWIDGLGGSILCDNPQYWEIVKLHHHQCLWIWVTSALTDASLLQCRDFFILFIYFLQLCRSSGFRHRAVHSFATGCLCAQMGFSHLLSSSWWTCPHRLIRLS